ncbi:unnamed protein product, partial [Choristocarpus tenellus]
MNFYDYLLISTLGPLTILFVLGITYKFAMIRNRGGPEATLMRIRRRHISVGYAVTFLVFSFSSSKIFQTFACEELEDGKTYLRADYSLECTSDRHQAFQAYAAIMIFVYPLGIPILYGYIFFANRKALMSKKSSVGNPDLQPFVELW